MSETSREMRLSAAFVMLADTLTADYDVIDLLHTLVGECTDIVDAQAGGMMLVGGAGGGLELMASTSESADLVEVMQLAAGAGPCVDCFLSGQAVSVPDIAAEAARWPEFSASALEQGFLAVHATPMRLRGEVIGTMNLFCTRIGGLSDRDAAVAQALADVATIGILQERIATQAHIVAEQLQRALDSRVFIEQAKGAVSQAMGVTMDEAFHALRAYARNHNLTLHRVAESIADRTLDVRQLWDSLPARTSPGDHRS
jgi:GAF domain-containing protein